MLGDQRCVRLSQLELNFLSEFPEAVLPVEVVEIALNYSEGPADGVGEGEASDPPDVGINWPS